MVNMTLIKSLALFLILTTNLIAETIPSQKTIDFVGQVQEEMILANKLIETRYRTEMQDSTCQREVPYQDVECEMVPRYDQVCTTIPGRDDCRTEYDQQCRTVTNYRTDCHTGRDRQVCRNETRYKKECERGSSRQSCRNVTRTRQECSTGSSTRDCHTEPAREQCRTNRNGERRCRQIPSRQICNTKPGERTCRDVSYTDRVCETEPGELVCRQVPYTENVCSTIPGEQTCREVPYTDTVCEDVPRQVCDWIPSREECDTVQVGEDQVCRDVTRYRTEDYACQIEVKIPYDVTLKEYEAKCLFSFNSSNYKKDFSFNTLLDEQGKISFNLVTESNAPIVFVDKILTNEVNDKVEVINAKFDLELLDSEKLSTMLYPTSDIVLSKEKLSFSLPLQELTSGFDIFLRLKEEGNKLISRKLTDSEIEIINGTENIVVNIGMKDLGINPKGFVAYQYAIKLVPKFKKELAFPLTKEMEFKTSGELYPALSNDDLEAFKRKLDQVTKIEFSTDKLSFEIQNHELIEDIQIKLKVGDSFNRIIKKSELTLTNSKEVIRASILSKDIAQSWNALKDYPVEISVKFVFTKDGTLPDDFKFTTKRKATIKPRLSSEQLAKIKSDGISFEGFKLYKKSIEFLVNKNKYLKDMSVKLIIKKKRKEKLNKIFALKDLVLKDVEGLQKVEIDFYKLGVKLSGFSKHTVDLEVVRQLDPNLKIDSESEFKIVKSFKQRAK